MASFCASFRAAALAAFAFRPIRASFTSSATCSLPRILPLDACVALRQSSAVRPGFRYNQWYMRRFMFLTFRASSSSFLRASAWPSMTVRRTGGKASDEKRYFPPILAHSILPSADRIRRITEVREIPVAFATSSVVTSISFRSPRVTV